MSLADNPQKRWPIRRGETGIRNIDRNFNAANPLRHRALHKLLYRMSERRNEPKWQRASDQAFAWFLEHAQNEKTGLLAWGEHIAWKLKEDRPVRHPDSDWADLKHEIWHDLPWGRLFRLNRQAAMRYAEGMWQYHVYDKNNGIHAHQTRWDKYAPDKGYVFPRMSGHLVLAFAWAHKYADDTKARQKWVERINLIADAHDARRDPTTGAYRRRHPKRDNFYPVFNDLQGVLDAHRALQLDLPKATEKKLKTWTRKSDQTFIAVGHAPRYIGWRRRVDAGDLSLRDNLNNANRTLWCSRYGKASPEAHSALRTYLRYQQTGDKRFLIPVLETAKLYLGTDPNCNEYPLWPGTLASVIDLMLVAHEETGQAHYLEEANRFGQRAVALFLDDTSPLPKVLSRQFSHYEAISGGPDLMLALHRLGARLESH